MSETSGFGIGERRLLAATLVLAPLVSLTCAGFFFFAPQHEALASGLLVLCGALFVGGLAGLAAGLRERGSRLSILASLAAMVAVMPASIGSHRLTLLAVESAVTAGPELTTQLMGVREDLLPVLVAPGILFPLLLVPLGIGLLVTRLAPRPIALAWVLGFALFPVGRIAGVMAAYLLGDVLIAIAAMWLAKHVVSGAPQRRT